MEVRLDDVGEMYVKQVRANKSVSVLLVACAMLAVVLLSVSDIAFARESEFRVGGSVVVGANERVFGDVGVVGGMVEILGEVIGEVMTIGGSVTIDGSVEGDVVAIGGTVRIGPTARVTGDVVVVAGTLDRHPDADILGETIAVTVAESLRFGVDWRWDSWFDAWRYWPLTLLYVAGLFALAALVAAWVPDRVRAVEQHMETNAGRSIVIGLLTLLLLVPLTVVLLLTIIGPPLLWVGFFVAKMFGYVALVSLIGRTVSQRFFSEASSLWQLVAGVLIVAVLRYVPIAGGLFSFIATVWSVGAVLDTKFGSNQPWIPPRQA